MMIGKKGLISDRTITSLTRQYNEHATVTHWFRCADQAAEWSGLEDQHAPNSQGKDDDQQME